ncbi:MAG: hypothetical protein NTU44_10615 [Bacteroidetes bacterium]|nr:hypothetical protein [Bacteroidota bacterium]
MLHILQYKYCRHWHLVMLLSFISFSARSTDNGIAGPDKTTCKKQDLTTIPIKIGKPALPGYCYTWSPAAGLDDAHSAHPYASPGSTTLYTVKATKENFEDEIVDQVTVTVGNLTSIQITPKRCCFKAGETVTNDMFEIVSTPPGITTELKFDPPVVPVQNMLQVYESNIHITSNAPFENFLIDETVTVTVVNEGVEIQVAEIPDFDKFSLQKVLKDINKAINRVKNFKQFHLLPCETETPENQINLVAKISKTCCIGADGCYATKYNICNYSPPLSGYFEL